MTQSPRQQQVSLSKVNAVTLIIPLAGLPVIEGHLDGPWGVGAEYTYFRTGPTPTPTDLDNRGG